MQIGHISILRQPETSTEAQVYIDPADRQLIAVPAANAGYSLISIAIFL